MRGFDVDLDGLSDDAARLEAIRDHAQTLGATMAISHHFCPPATYWADIIAPGRASVGRGATPLGAALTALVEFTKVAPTDPP
jgi:hypothetical protein